MLKHSLISKLITVFTGIALFLFYCLSASANSLANLRGQRYCEVLLAFKKDLQPYLNVYNTVGLNNCPLNQWNQLQPQQIRATTKAFFVHLNGPRYWVIDGMQNSTLVNPNIVVFGGIPMRLAGILNIRWLQFIKTPQPYTQRYVDRNTTWVYNAGKPIYELIDAKNNIYIMQSYSAQKVAQTEASLAELGSKLQLPAGWSFRTRVLTKNAYLTPINQKATVTQDDLLNTYQLETPGFNPN